MTLSRKRRSKVNKQLGDTLITKILFVSPCCQETSEIAVSQSSALRICSVVQWPFLLVVESLVYNDLEDKHIFY